MAKGYIYVIDPHVEVEGRSVVKIGLTTRSPYKRLKEIQTALPHKATLVHASIFPDVKWAERRLHSALSTRSVKAKGGTEFFFLTPKEATEYVNSLAYQVSADEAKRALEFDLENFKDKISNELQIKIAGLFALLAFLITVYFGLLEADSFSTLLLFLYVLISIGPAFFGAMIGDRPLHKPNQNGQTASNCLKRHQTAPSGVKQHETSPNRTKYPN